MLCFVNAMTEKRCNTHEDTRICAYAVDVRFVHIGVSGNRLEIEKPILLNMKRINHRISKGLRSIPNNNTYDNNLQVLPPA